VKRWQDGEYIIRTLAAGFMEAEKSFRRIKGYRQFPFLTNALCNSFEANSANSSAETA